MTYEEIYDAISKNLPVPNTAPFDKDAVEFRFGPPPMLATRLDGTNDADAVSDLTVSNFDKTPMILIDVFGGGHQNVIYPSRIIPGPKQGSFTVMSADDDHPDLMFRPITADDSVRIIGRSATLHELTRLLQQNDLGM